MKISDPILRKKKAQFNYRLLNWYRLNGRNFPWRNTSNPYYLFVAELLLQKTNAIKVVNPYLRLIENYPTPSDMKEAKVEDIKRIILSLGLLNKASLLIGASEKLIQICGREITINDLLSIKGVGNYIARAVVIHSYGAKYSLLDTNFIRIYKRVYGISSNLSRPRTDRKLWDMCEYLIPSNHISSYVYAVLDFGAEICLSSKPKCVLCPMFPDVCIGT